MILRPRRATAQFGLSARWARCAARPAKRRVGTAGVNASGAGSGARRAKAAEPRDVRW